MNLKDMFLYSIKNIRYTKIRSLLTVLGIVIGICAVVLLVGMAESLKAEVNSQLSSFGPRTIIVVPINLDENSASSPGMAQFQPSSGKLYEEDIETLKRIPELELVSPVLMGKANADYKEESITLSIMGIDPEIYEKTAGMLEIEKGRFLEAGDKNAVVLGETVALDTFDKEVEVNAILEIGGEKYKVVGTLKKAGSSFSSSDSSVFLIYDDAKDLLNDTLAEKEVSVIRILVKEGYDVEKTANEIEEILADEHKVSLEDKDFGVISPAYIKGKIDSILGTLTVFLVAVSGISLIVGGIGISNTMFMGVLERRNEIGTLLAIGEKKRDILLLFLIEASILGVIGGTVGMLIGILFLYGITFALGVQTAYSLVLPIGAIIFSALVGAFSGTFPAKQAAEVTPVESLRYE